MAAEAGGRSGDVQTSKGEPTGSEDESEAVCERKRGVEAYSKVPIKPRA